MYPKQLAVLIAAALLAPQAWAGSEVVLYGQVNVGVQADNHMDAFVYGAGRSDVKKLKVDNLGTQSRIGIKGKEDLGNGLSAVFVIETQVAPDNSARSGAFGNREAWIGLRSPAGTVSLGRGKSPFKLALDDFDFFDGYDGATLSLDSVDGGIGLDRRTDLFDRVNNTIKYESSDWNGFVLTGSYSTAENKTQDAKGNTLRPTTMLSLSGKYTSDVFWLEAAYGSNHHANILKNSQGVSLATPTGSRKDGYLFGGGYSLGNLNLSAAIEHTNDDDEKRNRYLVGASYASGPLTYKAGYIYGAKKKNPAGEVADSQYNHYIVGLNLALSRRTAVIAEYVMIGFKSTAASGVAVKNPSALTLGVLHSF